MAEVEMLEVIDECGDLQLYKATPLQKKVLHILPCLDNDNKISSAYDEACYALEKKQIDRIPFLTQMARRLKVNRATLQNAIIRKTGNNFPLTEMGIVKRMPISIGGRRIAYYYYKTQKEKITLQIIDDIPKIKSREEITPGYNYWRDEVLNRDEVCQCCGLDTHLQAHHLFGYKEHPELATDVGNGVTLCKFCHDKYHSIYGLKNINPVDYIEFIQKFKVR